MRGQMSPRIRRPIIEHPFGEMMAPSSSESSLYFGPDSLLCYYYLTVMALSLPKSVFYILLGLSIVMSTGLPSSHIYNHGVSEGEGIWQL